MAKTYLSAFIQALADLGWTEGRNARMDVRYAGDDIDRTRVYAQELVSLQPDIILAASTPVTVALRRETRTIPIVFAAVGDPVASGLIERLNQPGGNITGFANYEATLAGKWLELLAEIAPGLKRAGITNVHPRVAALGPTQVRKCLSEPRDASLRHGIVFVVRHEHPDAPHAVALLPPRQERRNRRAPKPRDELPPSH